MKPVVSRCPLPQTSALRELRHRGDFLDCFRVRSEMRPRPAAEIITDFPTWVQPLLTVRGVLTRPFGLKQSGPDGVESVGPFPVISDEPGEVIAGFDDKHLNFRVSVLRSDGHVHLATWVSCHNPGGKLYLTAILPFHIAIAKDALRRVARQSTSGHSASEGLEAG